ncbi:glycoside hydrolase family 88 protein [Draconibacterium sediminis]|uniref:glycoside hydrolase family 88 protein n=1 Tax=Draconibacterium sediminis TaxID=1544798 RepID=UPI0026E9B241|nr:glycoside hydrolase family 88 protein [Draconibacterium sediminis]
MNKKLITIFTVICTLFGLTVSAQKVNDVTTPLHLLQPDYPTPYGKPDPDDIIKTIDKVYNYLNESTPAKLQNKNTGKEITDFSKVDENTIFMPGDFRLNSYEWGVTYAGMLLASKTSEDPKYAAYTSERLNFMGKALDAFTKFEEQNPGAQYALYRSVHPHALDDCGAICAAMIKASNSGKAQNLDSRIKSYIDYISNKQFRFEDNTLARNRPQPNSLWLDDLFMSVPALAQMGSYSGDNKYFDDAVKQVIQFSNRMFNYEKGLYMHGWIMDMEEHPQFHWGRANGWAVMTLVELLEVLPEDYPERDKVLDLLKRHIKGLAGYQDGTGFWHQLIDRNDTYLETSATAIYTYAIARAINRGYVDAKVYGPVACLAWNAVSTKVNEKGQVEGTCVGTGMGFDPAFYYYRPVNVFAAHGYGPVILAGAEMIELVKTHDIRINDSSLQFYTEKKKSEWRFDFGNGKVADGFQAVTPATSYSKENGFGIISEIDLQTGQKNGSNKASDDWISSDAPFYFQVDVPEGRYKITLTLGNAREATATTVKAESRRLMLENIETKKGEIVTKTIIVDRRTPQINATEEIRRKTREMTYLNWDDRLTLEFNGPHPCVSSIIIEEANDLPVIYLAGNSTVVDQEYEPWASWGQMFTRFLKPEIVVANYAESGETLKAFRRENRLKKIISLIKPGDYLFIEFAHNDQKPGGNHVEPYSTYQDELRYYIKSAKEKGAQTVLVTSTNRRKFDEKGKIVNTLEEYPDAVRQLSARENIPLIDLNAMSKYFYESLGVENSKKAFVHYPANAFPNQDKPLADNTHFSPYGAYELAKCVVQELIDNDNELKKYIVDDWKTFDPKQPDNWQNFFWPNSPNYELIKPDGN